MGRPLEPLRFRRHFVEKPWGGRALERRFGFELPAGKRIGETWELVDREDENSVVEGGPFAGTTLRELMRTRAEELLGTASPARDGRFPLLVKYIDASENLSVQVHPDEESAADLGGGAEAKTEAWFVVDVAPRAKLFVGTKPGVDRAAFAAGIADGRVAELMAQREVERGDCLLVRGGTVHAIGAGVTILEVQQNSDTTYRIHDWGRVGLDGVPRETHVEPALACARFEQGATLHRSTRLERSPLAESHLFRMAAVRVSDRLTCPVSAAFRILAVVAGRGSIEDPDGGAWPLVPGVVWLIPASFGAHALVAEGGVVELIETVPVG